MDINNPIHRCFSILLAKCEVVAGKPGGLLTEEEPEFRRLADELGVEIVGWRRFELGKTLDWTEYPGEQENTQ